MILFFKKKGKMSISGTKILLDEQHSEVELISSYLLYFIFQNSQYIHTCDHRSIEIYINVPIYINSQQVGWQTI